jgi:type II secretory pathway pseudopilin PulG
VADRGAPGGFTLTELLTALLLGLLLGTLALATLARARGLVASMGRRGDALEAVRTARHVLAWELRVEGGSSTGEGAPGGGTPSDTLGLRAYRGVGVVCPGTPPGPALQVVAEGVRDPDPKKDSVRVVGAAGGETVAALLSVTPAPPCPMAPGRPAAVWTLSADPPSQPVVALHFERGSYHLTGGALRYRRGAAGRQPLTPEALRTPASRFEAWGGGTAVRLEGPFFPGTGRGVLPAGLAGRSPGP